jgi:hypothetical protein
MGVVRAARLGRPRRARARRNWPNLSGNRSCRLCFGNERAGALGVPRWQLPPLTERGPGPLKLLRSL